MSVGKIALGVFLGNIAFGLLVWLVATIVVDQTRVTAMEEQTSREFQALRSQQARGNNYSTP